MVKGKLTGCAHAGIFCTNREETVRFYEDVLGCECLFRATSTGLHIAVVQLGDFKIELLEPEEPDDRIVPSAKKKAWSLKQRKTLMCQGLGNRLRISTLYSLEGPTASGLSCMKNFKKSKTKA